MKSLTSYYNETIRFLRIAGREYSDAHPDTARYLNRDNLETVWPGFEDLLQGLGFLGARIHALLDKTRNDFYGDLAHLFWPHLAVEVPSVTITAFSPVFKKIATAVFIPRGTRITSQGKHTKTPCIFSTTRNVHVSPLELAGVETKDLGPNAGELTFRFSLKEGLARNDFHLDPLRIHLVGELPVTIALHELLTRHVTQARITVGKGNDTAVVRGDQNTVTPGGMGPDEPLLPPNRHSNPAFSCLTEYFVFREKFLCLDLHGLQEAVFRHREKSPSRVEVALTFDRGLPKDKPFEAANFRLFCTPAVNLFQRSIEPVAAKLTYDEYPLSADNASSASVVPHSVISVTGINRSTGERVDYAPMTSFKAAGTPTWLLKYRTDPRLRQREALLCLGGRQPLNAPPDGENISVEAWCSNGDLPHKELHEGDLTSCMTGLPHGISVTNITRPTERAFPRDDVPLDLLTVQLGALYDELTSANCFSSFLRAHDRSDSEGNRRRTGSIRTVTRTKTETFVEGTPLPCLRYAIAIDEPAFSDLNDVHLFGQTIAVFLSRWSRMETSIEITLVCKPSGRTLSWSSLEPWIHSTDGVVPALPETCAGETPQAGTGSVTTTAGDGFVRDTPSGTAQAPGVDLEALMKKIEIEARSLNFFGTLRLLDGYYAARGEPDPYKSGHLLLVPDSSFSFPSSDIVCVERQGDRFLVRCAFLSLAGVSSPLPAHWSQVIVEKPETAAALLALLTLFNRRFYELFYEAHKKYRLDPIPGFYGRDPLVRRVAELGGLLPEDNFSESGLAVLSSISLFATSPRSATGLAAVISSYLGNIPVSIKRFMPHDDAIPPELRTRPGIRNCSLGRNALLGSVMNTRGSRFRISLGPLSRSLFENILSGGFSNNGLHSLISSYIETMLDYDIELLIRYGDLPPAAVGGARSRLGVNALLGAPPVPCATAAVIIESLTSGNPETVDSPDPRHRDHGVSSGRTLDKYYEEDLRSLYKSAHLFSKAFPYAGNKLSITSTGTTDPAAARLFQGAALLSARAREILDDTLPELSERLFQARWPEFLHAIPSATIVEFTPGRGALARTGLLPRGTEILSKSIPGGGGKRIVFTTSYDVQLNPIVLESVEKSTDSRGRGRIELRFLIDKGISWQAINLDPLRLYLHADEKTAFSLHRMFMHDTDKVSIRYDGGGPGRETMLENALDSPVRFPFCDPDFRLMHSHCFKSTGCVSLMEYCEFRRKFLFIDLHGFHDRRFTGVTFAPQSCTVTVFFKGDFSRGEELSFDKETFRLFCSPAVNICRRNASLAPTGIIKGDYKVVAPADASESLEPHSVSAVSGFAGKDEGPREYIQKHLSAAFDPAATQGTWESRTQEEYDGRRSVRLRIAHGAGKNGPVSNVTASAFFSNGAVPHTALAIGDIAFHAAGFPDRIDFVNLTRPTLPVLPPAGEEQWRFIALAGAAPASSLDAARLKQLLKLFERGAGEGKHGLSDAVLDFGAVVVRWVKGAELLRGMEYTLTLDESLLSHTYDLHIFGRVLGEFLRSKTIVSSFISLVINTQPSGKSLRWERMAGSFGISA